MSEQPREPIDDLEWFAIQGAVARASADENRIGLLVVHGVTSLLVGFLVAIDGPSSTLVRNFHGPFLSALNLMPGLGGGILLAGLLMRRNLKIEAAGILMLLIWNTTMAIFFLVSAQHAARDHDPTTLATSYPVGVYAGIAALLAIHMRTLVSMIREHIHADR